VVPSTVEELQALLDNNGWMNRNCPVAGEASADNYYMTTADYNSAPGERERSLYTWSSEIIYNNFPNEWSNAYMPVYYANVVLENLGNIQRTAANSSKYDNARGSAFLFRAKAFLVTVLNWAKAYDAATAATDLGVPLRLTSDFNQPSVRAPVKQVYDQIIADLQAALPLLPASPLHPVRPSKQAAWALLSRTWLAMQDYQKAGIAADSALAYNHTLMDYNTLNASAGYPMPQFNKEVIMHFSTSGLAQVHSRVDTVLYNSYAATDLRKSLFFRANGDGSFAFRGSYDGSATLFTGLAVDELYLTRAECRARTGNTPGALADLNTLLEKRFKTGTFTPVTATSAGEALDKILEERRKSLAFRDLRWMDIKRLNKEGLNITLTRVIGNEVFTLPPNDPRFALPLPAAVIDLTGMPQNPR
jgi:starch-binding outer membrane protein, SusD/RagB family